MPSRPCLQQVTADQRRAEDGDEVGLQLARQSRHVRVVDVRHFPDQIRAVQSRRPVAEEELRSRGCRCSGAGRAASARPCGRSCRGAASWRASSTRTRSRIPARWPARRRPGTACWPRTDAAGCARTAPARAVALRASAMAGSSGHVGHGRHGDVLHVHHQRVGEELGCPVRDTRSASSRPRSAPSRRCRRARPGRRGPARCVVFR